jgi:N-acetylmuramoyl-L-alanine amidase
MAKKVFIGVGHGGKDSGAVANGVKEKDANLQIALACERELARHGVTVLMSRAKDEDDPLNEEVKECNAFAPDLAVDIHNNAGGGDGGEAFYHYKGGVSKTLAENVVAEIVNAGQNSRGIKTRRGADGCDYYGFIRQTKAPAIIVECAFLDNKNDVQIIDTPAEQQAMGVAIAKGVLKTLGIAYVPAQKEEPKKETATDKNVGGKIYRVQVGAYSVKDNAVNMQKKLKAAGFDAIIV